MVAELAERAVRDGKSIIELSFRPTDRNEPARAFLEQLGAGQPVPKDRPSELELPAAPLATLRYAPDAAENSSTQKTDTPDRQSEFFHQANMSRALQRLGDELTTVESVVSAMESARHAAQPTNAETSEPEFAGGASALERALTAVGKRLWAGSEKRSRREFLRRRRHLAESRDRRRHDPKGAQKKPLDRRAF